jgi:hypothetical protein
VAIEGRLVRPSDVTVDVSVVVTGTDIDTTSVEDALIDLLAGLGLGDDVIRDQIIATAITADDDIVGIDTLTTSDSNGTFSADRAIGARENPVAGSISVTVV